MTLRTSHAVTSLGALVLSLALVGCTGGGDGDGDATPTPTATAAAAPTVTDITDDPGTAPDYVGALADVQQTGCELSGDAWTVTGTTNNPTDAAQNYRIYVSLLDPEQNTAALSQVDVAAVPAGGASDWEASLATDADDLSCVLRVERFAA